MIYQYHASGKKTRPNNKAYGLSKLLYYNQAPFYVQILIKTKSRSRYGLFVTSVDDNGV